MATSSACRNFTPSSGGSRNDPTSDPSSSQRQLTDRAACRVWTSEARTARRCAATMSSSCAAVACCAQDTSVATLSAVTIRVIARTFEYDNRPVENTSTIKRIVGHHPSHPHLLAGGGLPDPAFPGQPVRGRAQPPLPPPFHRVELRDQQQLLAHRTGKLTRQLHDPRLNMLQRRRQLGVCDVIVMTRSQHPATTLSVANPQQSAAGRRRFSRTASRPGHRLEQKCFCGSVSVAGRADG